MRVITPIGAAARTDPGRQRDVNEDRAHVDVARGIFVVIDGVGGQAAGGKAADVALSMLRTRLERETGPTPERIREAIAIANNEIHRLASMRPEWNGMACVLTVVVVEDGQATIGHVGDTRLYKCRHDRIEKITRDHSPVGEREDANELSESEAMRHPRRNEVYRDVGSESHEPDDSEFVDLRQIVFEPDAALLLCSDGLTDLVDSSSIGRLVRQFAGDPDAVTRALVDAANQAGGTDNVTVVFVEGERFPASQQAQTSPIRSARIVADGRTTGIAAGERTRAHTPREAGVGRRRLVSGALIVLLLAVVAIGLVRARVVSWPPSGFAPVDAVVVGTGNQAVRSNESIAAAIERASAGSQVVVDPGEYREQLRLREGVRVVSRVPRAATIRLPATASEGEAAVVAEGLSAAEFVGFRIVGDAATPLGIGLLVTNAAVSIVNVEITGATRVAIDFAAGAAAVLVGSDIRDNPGAALAIRGRASPRIEHSWLARNGMSERAPASFLIEPGATPVFERNVFQGIRPEAFVALAESARQALKRDNWFPDSAAAPPPAAVPRPRKGR